MRSIMGRQQQPAVVVLQQDTGAAQPPPLVVPQSAEELARRVAAILEPGAPDLSSVNCAGPVFGRALEQQVESPDYERVPLILHAMVKALETQGLEYEGLYRTPGRQKEINRFICLTNVVSWNCGGGWVGDSLPFCLG